MKIYQAVFAQALLMWTVFILHCLVWVGVNLILISGRSDGIIVEMFGEQVFEKIIFVLQPAMYHSVPIKKIS
jgi:hypothetical protein